MKRMLLLAAAIAATTAGTALAEGDYVPGYVYVSPNGDYMYGTFSNRYITTPSTHKSYLGAGGYANGLLYFYGQDEIGRYFYCYVPTSSAIYQAATDIKNSLSNGSLLAVERVPPSSECASVYSAKASHYLF